MTDQTYNIGLKEVWQVNGVQPGTVLHTVGFPTPDNVFSGGFLYTSKDRIQLGLVVGLDYKKGNVNPYELFQTWKTHPQIKHMIEKGKCISYGARALNAGG